MKTPQCLLCNGLIESSLEHILPKGLFEGHIHDIFRTNNICPKCNNDVGLKVDGAFLRDPMIMGIRASSVNLWFMFSKFIDISQQFTCESQKEIPINEATYRVDLYGIDNSYIYLISKASPNFKTYVGSNPIKKKITYAIIILNQNFNTELLEQYLNTTPKIIHKFLGTKNIYIKTPITINLVIDGKTATNEQLNSYYKTIGILPYNFLSDDAKNIIIPIFKFLDEEYHQKNRCDMQFSLDLSVYYKEIAKITYLVGHNILGINYSMDSISQCLHAIMNGNASPVRGVILNNMGNSILNKIKDKCFDPFIKKCTKPTLIISIRADCVPNNLLMLFFYGVKNIPSYLFWSIITEDSNLIDVFNLQHSTGIHMIKHTDLNNCNTFQSIEDLFLYMDNYT